MEEKIYTVHVYVHTEPEHSEHRVKTKQPAESPLTSRQAEVLRYIAEGYRRNQIASKLGITPQTVNVHVHTILSRLHAATHAQAVAIAVREGYITS